MSFLALTLYFILLCVGIAVTGVFLFLRVKKGGTAGLISKAAASLCFIATAFAAMNVNKDFVLFGSLMGFGLVLGLMGDVWLDLKWVYPKDKDLYLYSGFISFLLCHVLFNAAIYTAGALKPVHFVISAVIAVLISVGNLLLEKPMKLKFGKFRLIVFLYVAFLSLTMASAIVAAIVSGFKPLWVVMSIGAVLFTLSDMVLSGMYFGEGKNTKFNVILNHTLYYAAQFLMAATILFIR